ncbi:MAG TPA: hypothetical protein VFG69_07920 [Nannocystaceae bacterium]|nr:hypothetical protein [Nannocystaceae bacterium]
MIGAALHAPAGEDAFEVFEGLGPQFGILLLLVPLAILVVWVARRQSFAGRTSGERARARPDWADPQWRARVAELEAGEPIAIAAATSGVVRFVATIVSAPQALGGPPGRECVWRNYKGSGPDTAIASELVFVADASGRCAVEGLEHARVIAPFEPPSRPAKARGTGRGEHVALYVGDEIEIYARFAPDRVGEDPDPSKLVYGTAGAAGPLEIRLRTRPTPAAAEPTPPTDADANDEGASP